MRRLFGILGSMVGGYAGWAIGAPAGVMTAYMVSAIGTGVGIWGGFKLARRYLP